MVGIFSRFAAGRTGHRRTKSATETRGTQSSASMETGDESSTSTCKDNDNSRAEFKPIEHPLEPSNHDRPIRCPLPDPSILNVLDRSDSRMSWRGRRGHRLPPLKGRVQELELMMAPIFQILSANQSATLLLRRKITLILLVDDDDDDDDGLDCFASSTPFQLSVFLIFF
ncbi:uncharacterized protein LOC122016744 isoform X1 [Zingiber officinale]|uniref:uncharacterized protein LOC122016744 isoform X1 n=1 Tax=Zingiber officinale TaxID=94328 RepID=UPI001C4C2F34|nr:uncharacterized protein LOC122016744 isoform X1 [Zingiber officinale]